MKSNVLHFLVSFVINLIFWVEIFYGYGYRSSQTWAWLDFAWMVLTPAYGIWSLLKEKSRLLYLAGLVASLLAVLAAKYVFMITL